MDNKEFTSYDLEISKSSEFSSIPIKQTTRKILVHRKSKNKWESYSEWVRGILPDGRKSEFSRVNPFRIKEPSTLKLTYPEALSELDMTPDKSVTFRWQRPETSGNFILEVSNSPDFSNQLLTEEEKL